MKIAINGFGRIGRNFLRGILQDQKARDTLDVVAINIGPAYLEHTAHLFKHDTLMGTYPGNVSQTHHQLIIDGYTIELIAEIDPCSISWKKLGVEWVVDASGKFTDADKARVHLQSGAKAVLITAPAHGEDITIVPGVNEQQFNKAKHHIVSLGSCTTNAFIPLIKIMHDAFHIEQGVMTSIHSYTNSQVLLDIDAKDLRRARAAALNIIPTGTGAARMIKLFFPDLNEKLQAYAVRVPVAKVSLIDFSFLTSKPLSIDLIHDALRQAIAGPMKDYVGLCHEPLVSSDFSCDSRSVVVDGLLSSVIGKMGKLFGWYDNEWAYSMRLRDFLLYVAHKG